MTPPWPDRSSPYVPSIRHRPRTRIALILGAVIVSGLAGSWLNLGSLPARDIGLLASGQFQVDVPFLTFYTLPELVPGTTVETAVWITGSEPFAFRWSGTSSIGTTVRFVFRPPGEAGSYSFVSSEDGGFLFQTPGAEGFGSQLPSQGWVTAHRWQINYVAKRMAVYDGFFERTWVEILFTPSVVLGQTIALPSLNVSLPDARSLVSTGIVDTLDTSGSWSYERSLGDFGLPHDAFRNRIPAVTIDVGAAGTVSAVLECAFRWGPAGGYRATASGSGAVRSTIAWYWDARFGSLYPLVT